MFICNPPAKISMDGEWDDKLNLIYEIFLHDVIENKLSFNGKPVYCNNAKDIIDNREKIFWHLITKDYRDLGRVPDYERCEKIAWPRYFIDVCSNNCANVKIWAKFHDKTNKDRIYIWCEKFNYVVILEKRHNSYFLITAYNVEYANIENDFKNDYSNWLKTKTPID